MFLEKDIESFCTLLSYEEIDALKFTVSILSRKEMDDEFSISKDELKRKKFNSYLNILAKIQPFASKVPEFGLVYRGKPHFITEKILKKLQNEAEQFRPFAKSVLPEKSSQLIYQPMNLENESVAEKLANSEDLLELVEKYSGKVLPSFMTSFVYYDEEGRSSPPHVDNAFTSITVMLMLKHEVPAYAIKKSRSVVYWSNKERFDYTLEEGEISIFFGVSALHGRTPISYGEKVHSILFSFRPKELFT